jgi:hypothetical protein
MESTLEARRVPLFGTNFARRACSRASYACLIVVRSLTSSVDCKIGGKKSDEQQKQYENGAGNTTHYQQNAQILLLGEFNGHTTEHGRCWQTTEYE